MKNLNQKQKIQNKKHILKNGKTSTVNKTLFVLKFVFLIFGFSFLILSRTHPLLTTPSYARENKATDSSKTIDKINLLKEKVASRVAEIEETLKYASYGKITEISEEIISITVENQEKTVTVDSETKYLARNTKLQTSMSNFADLKENDNVTIIGLEQLGTDIITAKLIVKAPETVFFAGVIKKTNQNNGTFTIVEADEEYIFDYEVYTKAYQLKKDKNKLELAGFSDLKVDSMVQILAIPQKASETRFTALRLITIP